MEGLFKEVTLKLRPKGWEVPTILRDMGWFKRASGIGLEGKVLAEAVVRGREWQEVKVSRKSSEHPGFWKAVGRSSELCMVGKRNVSD